MIEGDAKGDTTGFILLLLITQVNHHYWSVYGYDRRGCEAVAVGAVVTAALVVPAELLQSPW